MAGNSMGACNVLLVLHLLHFKFGLAEGSNPSPASKAREMNAISFFFECDSRKETGGAGRSASRTAASGFESRRPAKRFFNNELQPNMKQEMITIMASSDYTAYDIADMIDIRYHYSVALITPRDELHATLSTADDWMDVVKSDIEIMSPGVKFEPVGMWQENC